VSKLARPEGNLASCDFPDLVQALHTGRATGKLTLTRGGVGKSVFVDEGRLIFASSSSIDDRLGELLLRRGCLSFRQLLECGRAVAPGRRLGAILVERGILSPKELVRAVVEHTQEVIYSLFQWTEGRYRFEERPEASQEAITLRISTPDIILEGVRRIDSWSRIERAVGGVDAVYGKAPGAARAIEEMRLSHDQQALLGSFTAPRTVGDICDGSVLPDFEVCRCLWAYRVIGAVHRLDRPLEAAMADPDGLGAVLAAGKA
jgi:hypothetical protein